MFKSCRDVLIPSSSKKNEAEKFFNCDYCDIGWQSETEVFLHRKSHRNQIVKLIAENTPVCLICLKRLKTRAELVKHVKIYHLLCSENSKQIEREIFICDVCSSICFNKKMLQFHITHFHPSFAAQKEIECPQCHVKLKNIKEKKYSQHRHLQNFRYSGLCPICLESFQNDDQMIQHTQNHKRFYYCGICGDYFSNGYMFSSHMEQHEKVAQSHIKNIDANDTSFTKFFVPQGQNVQKLDYGFKTQARGLLLRNMLNVCIMCREICDTKKEMRLHALSHIFDTEEPKYPQINVCRECCLTFENKILLKQHSLKCQPF